MPWQRAGRTGSIARRAANPAGLCASSTPRPWLSPTGTADFRRGNPRFTEPNFSANLQALEALNSFAKARGVTPGQVSLAWVLAQGEHLIPIPGSRYAANVCENAGAVAIALSAGDLAELARLLPVGFAHGDRYTAAQWVGPERYS